MLTIFGLLLWQLRDNMPRLVEAVRDSAQVVTWVCDPMHGNTESVAGFKTRRYDRIRAEVQPYIYAVMFQ